ncbi:MAG: CpsD/CapB family tyrosine-protein kinase [Candidatus Eisenbacteria bacterium]|nr:CpsD/CapB family tyrosine-protein kinase [Candidatus Eisenbacteria bacterium]
MSNIFDALKKNQAAGVPVAAPQAGFPVQPEAGAGAIAPEKGGPDFHLMREMETLRERIDLELPRTGKRVITVVSSVPGEGASTVALHLARAFARGPAAKVLLIDADLVRSNRTLSDAIAHPRSGPGLIEVLSRQIDLSRAILSTEDPNLHFLPAGGSPARPMEVIISESMGQFLQDMGQVYQTVVLDGPPVLQNPEGPALGASSEGVVLVVQANRTRREVVQRALTMLESARCKVLGTVLNRRSYPIPDFLYRRL